MSDLHHLTALEQRDALRRRAISATELTEHYLARIDQHGADLGAFVELTHDLARTEAAAADARLAAGDQAPLLGLPLAFKDLHPVRGVRLRMGSAAFDQVPPEDSKVVGLLRQAGVVTVGTTHAPELGPTCFTHPLVVDKPAVTPYDTSRYASGSSGGTAAAVAAGLLPFGHASDGAGSTRTPAAVCGLVGFKPSRGVLSPPSPSFVSLGIEGPITRTVADAALVADVMAQVFPGDLYARPVRGSFLGQLAQAPRPLRVLRYDDSGLTPVDPECGAAVDEAERLLRELGHEVVTAANPVPWDEDLRAAMRTVFAASTSVGAGRIAPTAELQELLHPYTRYCVETASHLSASDYALAQGALATATSRLLELTAPFDLCLTPTSAAPAVPVGWFSEQGDGEECANRMLGWSAFTPWANFAGQPAVSLPLHVTPDGLPVGAHLVGRPGADLLVLQVAAAIEAAAPFADRHPVQW